VDSFELVLPEDVSVIDDDFSTDYESSWVGQDTHINGTVSTDEAIIRDSSLDDVWTLVDSNITGNNHDVWTADMGDFDELRLVGMIEPQEATETRLSFDGDKDVDGNENYIYWQEDGEKVSGDDFIPLLNATGFFTPFSVEINIMDDTERGGSGLRINIGPARGERTSAFAIAGSVDRDTLSTIELHGNSEPAFDRMNVALYGRDNAI